MKKKFNIIFKINMYVLFLIMFLFTTNLVYAVAQSRYIAEVDSVKYDDYEDAWDEAVSSGKEIKMLSDWIIDDVLSIDSSKTVNLTMNGYMINRGRTSSTRSGQIFNVKKSATLNIIGGGNNEHRT